MILNSGGTFGAALLTKMGRTSGTLGVCRWSPMDLHSRSNPRPIIWLIFPKRNDVLLCLAAIKRHMEQDRAQGTPDWLRLSYLTEEGGGDCLEISALKR